MISNTPCTATPRMRKGTRSNQMKGYAMSAIRASGQQSTKRMHQRRNVNMGMISSSKVRSAATKVPCFGSRSRLGSDGRLGAGKVPEGFLIRRAGDAFLGNDGGHILRRRYIEGGIFDLHAVGHHLLT